MELTSARGASLLLRPTPEVPRTKGVRKGPGPAGVPLMCLLRFTRPGQPDVEMSAPIVRISEAHKLADFLDRVADGTQPAGTIPGVPSLGFATPYLAFDLAALDASAATFRIHLAVPPPGGTVSDIHDLVSRRAPLTVPRAVVAQAAATWRGEIPPMP